MKIILEGEELEVFETLSALLSTPEQIHDGFDCDEKFFSHLQNGWDVLSNSGVLNVNWTWGTDVRIRRGPLWDCVVLDYDKKYHCHVYVKVWECGEGCCSERNTYITLDVIGGKNICWDWCIPSYECFDPYTNYLDQTDKTKICEFLNEQFGLGMNEYNTTFEFKACC